LITPIICTSLKSQTFSNDKPPPLVYPKLCSTWQQVFTVKSNNDNTNCSSRSTTCCCQRIWWRCYCCCAVG